MLELKSLGVCRDFTRKLRCLVIKKRHISCMKSCGIQSPRSHQGRRIWSTASSISVGTPNKAGTQVGSRTPRPLPLLTLAPASTAPLSAQISQSQNPAPLLSCCSNFVRRPSNSKSSAAAAEVIASNFYSKHVIRIQNPSPENGTSRRSPS